ncbi:MAG: DUF6446 family protein [Pseudomonadota bacterium]
MGKFAVLLILLSTLIGGVAIWYTQTRAFWSEIDGPVTLTLATEDGLTTLPAQDVRAIASTSSPLGFRACFQHLVQMDALGSDLPVTPMPDAAPTIPPDWFDCFDAPAIGALLAGGDARAFLAYPNVAYGVDRIVALAPDGRGWAWHELNDCGRKAYDGTPVGQACPDRATFTPLIEGSL